MIAFIYLNLYNLKTKVMNRFTLILCLLFVFSIRMMQAQSSQVAAVIPDDNTVTTQPVALNSLLADQAVNGLTGQPRQALRLDMVASPNPFSTRTMITFSLPAKCKLRMEIRNMFGETVKSMEENVDTEGSHSLEISSEHLQPGIYTAMLIVKTDDNMIMSTIRLVYNQ